MFFGACWKRGAGPPQRDGQVPERTRDLDARERQLEQREWAAEEVYAAVSERARRVSDLTATARGAIERARRHMETSADRLDYGNALLDDCLEQLRRISDVLGTDLTVDLDPPLRKRVLQTAPAGSREGAPGNGRRRSQGCG